MFTSTKKKGSSSVFTEQVKRLQRKRRRVERAERDTKEKRGVTSILPLTPQKTHRASGWPHRAQGQKVRGKVSSVPSIPLVLRDTHPYSHINTCLHAHAYTQTGICLKVALTSRSVLGQPENGDQPSTCFTMLRNCCGNIGWSVCSSKLYKD